jgi:putative chitobiose transport system substrate-binding protein
MGRSHRFTIQRWRQQIWTGIKPGIQTGIRVMATIGCLLLLLVGLVSCNPDKRDDRAEVEFWTMQLQPQYTDYFTAVISQFEQENPGLRINWVDVPWSGMESKILTAVAAKTAPDVVNLNPNFASQLAAKGAWLDLSARIPPETVAQYLPNIWQASTIDGKAFGIPWYLTTRIAIYNQALFQQAGLSKPPTNFLELMQVAPIVKEKTGKYAFFMTFAPMDSGEVLESFVQRGVQLVDRSGKAAFNTPLARSIFQDWVNLYEKNLIPKEVLTEGYRYGLELYQRGETAIVATSPEFFKTLAKNSPTIAAQSLASQQITGETGKRNVAVMNLVVPKDTDQPEAALKFALFVANPVNQLSFAKAANVLPSTESGLQDSYFTSLPDVSGPMDRARITSAAQLKSAEVLIPAMKDGKRLQKVIYENLQSAMLGQKTIDRALADAERAWNEGG